MRFTITFKTPDALDDAIRIEHDNLVDRFCVNEDVEEEDDLSDELLEELQEEKYAASLTMRRTAERFIRQGEYVTVEFDTEAGTATVIERN